MPVVAAGSEPVEPLVITWTYTGMLVAVTEYMLSVDLPWAATRDFMSASMAAASAGFRSSA